jgi:hypothetical protein
MPAQRVNTATLIRGQVLSFRLPKHLQKKIEDAEPIRFAHGKPLPIADTALLKHLEDMHDEIEDGEGEVYAKPVFRIERNVELLDDGSVSRVKRLASDRVAKRRPKRVK